MAKAKKTISDSLPTPKPINPNIPWVTKGWLEFLPAPFCDDPDVVVYMIPPGAKYIIRECSDGVYKGINIATARVEEEGKPAIEIPLHFVGKDYGNQYQHAKLMREMGGKLHPIKYTGKLSGMPAACTMSSDFIPIILDREKFHNPVFDLRTIFSNLTKKVGIHG